MYINKSLQAAGGLEKKQGDSKVEERSFHRLTRSEGYSSWPFLRADTKIIGMPLAMSPTCLLAPHHDTDHQVTCK